MKPSEKQRAIDMAMNLIVRSYGNGAVMRLGDDASPRVEAIPTGCTALDNALGIGGIPRGRTIEIFGPEASGKTTLALMMAAQAQQYGTVLYIDMEHALDPAWVKMQGVNTDAMLVSQPNDAEQALEICDLMVRSGAISAVVIDSVAALVPRAEISCEMGDSTRGLQSRLMSQAMRKLTGVVGKTKCCLIFVNQLREKPGIAAGNPTITTGGHALKYYSSVRLDVRAVDRVTRDGGMIGQRCRVRVIKNKMAPPYKEATMDILFDGA